MDIKQAVFSWLQTLDTDFFYAGIKALVQHWDKCSNSIVTLLKSGVYHLLCMCNVCIEVRIKFLASVCFVCYLVFLKFLLL